MARRNTPTAEEMATAICGFAWGGAATVAMKLSKSVVLALSLFPTKAPQNDPR